MKSIDLIRTAMQIADQGTFQLLDDMRNAPLTRPTPRGGNHPWWVLGHLTIVEGDIPAVLFGENNPVEHWKQHFGIGTEPKADGAGYPPYDEILRTYRDLRTRNLKLLDDIGEAGLDKPCKAIPPGFEEILTTYGQTFLVIAMHQMNHRGQVADARRAAGRKVLFVPPGTAAVA